MRPPSLEALFSWRASTEPAAGATVRGLRFLLPILLAGTAWRVWIAFAV
jgi:hypothetical protein